MTKCIICKSEAKDSYCEDCGLILRAIDNNYNLSQVMEMFSHILGAKLTKHIADSMYDALGDHYINKTEGSIH